MKKGPGHIAIHIALSTVPKRFNRQPPRGAFLSSGLWLSGRDTRTAQLAKRNKSATKKPQTVANEQKMDRFLDGKGSF